MRGSYEPWGPWWSRAWYEALGPLAPPPPHTHTPPLASRVPLPLIGHTRAAVCATPGNCTVGMPAGWPLGPLALQSVEPPSTLAYTR